MLYFLFILLIPVFSYFYSLYNNKKREKIQEASFEASFGKEKHSSSSSPKQVAAYWRYLKKNAPHRSYVDETTWNDLSMDEIFMDINNCQSSPGEEVLYATLHQNISYNDEEIKNFEALQQFLVDQPKMRLALQMHFARLGKSPFASLVELFESPKSFVPYNPKAISRLGYVPLLALPLIFINPVVALVFFILAAVVNMLIFYQFSQHLQLELPVITHLNYFLYTAKKIFQTLPLDELPQAEEATRAFSLFDKVSANLSRAMESTVQGNNEFVMLARLGKMMFLRQIIAYNKGTRVVQSHLKDLGFLYRYVGGLDMAVSVASYRQLLPYYCLPTYGEALTINAQKAYHPALPHGVANSLVTNRSIILTGSNASGKSTFLKTIAINSIFAHSLHTCCAKSFTLPNAPVYTSMAISDSLFKGESYFIAEIKSIKRILQAISQAPCLCFIDEILRGTNTIERIAASAAILEEIVTLPCLCMIATHDIELTEIFKNLYDFYHFREFIDEKDILFDYILYPGPSQTKNAIELLNMLGFEKPVINKARSLARYFEDHRQWLSPEDEHINQAPLV